MKVIFTLSFCFWWAVTFAQQIAPTLVPLKQVEQLVMPFIDNDALIAKEAQRRANREIPEFAVSQRVYVQPQTHGNWEVLTDGTAVWRVSILSKGAHSLNLGFTNFNLPKNAQLFLYSPDQKDILGPFSQADNEEHQQLWTPILPGESLVVELQVPQQERANVNLLIEYVNHDFIGFGKLLSQNCHLDVNCDSLSGFPELEAYRDIIQSVGMYSLNGVRACTGFLINNVRQDCTPFFMTAFHCEVNERNAPSVVVYWNYENSTCRPVGLPENSRKGDGPLIDFNTGSTLIAANAPSDMALLKLDDAVSSTANAFFAGWTNADLNPSSTICIHHPNTEEKRISFSEQPTYDGLWGSGSRFITNGDHLVVPNWNIGSTEGGSSGAPLFDTNSKRVIGQLHGGQARCGNQEYDSFGKFHTSWEGNGTPNTRLKDWLDPDGLELSGIDGYYQNECGKTIVPSQYVKTTCSTDTVMYQLVFEAGFVGEINLSIAGLPEAIAVSFSKNPVVLQDTITLQLSQLEQYQDTIITWTVLAKDSIGIFSTPLQIRILGNTLQAASLLSPTNNNLAVNDTPIFTWENSGLGLQYQFQLALDSAFEQIVADTSGLTTPYWQSNRLTSTDFYYWRVRSYNSCTAGVWSSPYTFITATCRQYLSTQSPVTISQGPAGNYVSILDIPESGSITDVNVIPLKGKHSWISDLQFSLTSPDGSVVQLMNRPCFDENDFNIVFDDESISAAIPCPLTNGLAYKPLERLKKLNGENMQGVWQLQIRDNEDQDGGRLDAWGLKVCSVSERFDLSVNASENDFVLCGENDIFFTVQWGSDFTPNTTQIELKKLPLGVQAEIAANTVSRSASIQLRNLSRLAAGTYTVLVALSDEQFSNTKRITIQKIPSTIPTRLLLPKNKAENIKVPAKFEWQDTNNAATFQLELALDSTFSNGLSTYTTGLNSYTKRDSLLQDTTYFWRIITQSTCETDTSVVFQFSTERLVNIQTLPNSYFSVYPNPTTSEVQVAAIENKLLRMEINVITPNGRRIKQQAGYETVTVDLSNHPSGIYLLQIVTSEGMLWKKVLLE